MACELASDAFSLAFTARRFFHITRSTKVLSSHLVRTRGVSGFVRSLRVVCAALVLPGARGARTTRTRVFNAAHNVRVGRLVAKL